MNSNQTKELLTRMDVLERRLQWQRRAMVMLAFAVAGSFAIQHARAHPEAKWPEETLLAGAVIADTIIARRSIETPDLRIGKVLFPIGAVQRRFRESILPVTRLEG